MVENYESARLGNAAAELKMPPPAPTMGNSGGGKRVSDVGGHH